MNSGERRITIDRLVLDGVSLTPTGAEQLRARVEGELARLLRAGSEDRVLTTHERPHLVAAPLPPAAAGDATRLARAVAVAVAGAVTTTPAERP